MKQVQLEVEGMSCGHCVQAVKQALSGIEGVRVDEVSIGKARVSFDEGRVAVATVIDAVADAGYAAREAA